MTWQQAARQLWPLVARHLPEEGGPARRGRPRIANEIVFHKLIMFVRAGCSWETFDELCRGSDVSGRTLRRRMVEWFDELGLFEIVCDELRSELSDAEIAHLDAMFVRSRGGGEDLVGLTRHGKGSKLQALVNEDSLPLMFQLTSANPNESTITKSLLEDVDELPAVVVADKAYDYDFLRDEFEARGSKLMSPHRADRKKPPRDQEQIGRHYKKRWVVERLFAWLAAWRRLANRWERNADRYWQWLCLGISLIYVRRKYCP